MKKTEQFCLLLLRKWRKNMYADRLKKFTELYKKLTLAHNGDMVFTDFVKLCAISIYN